MSNYNKTRFEKEFKKAIPNFDETKVSFSYKSRGYEPATINIVWAGKLWHMKMYKFQYGIDLWKNHFIDFFNTGEFDYNAYWRIYGGTDQSIIWIGDETYKASLCKRFGNDFSEHSPEFDELCKTTINEKRGKQYGVRLVPKTLNT